MYSLLKIMSFNLFTTVLSLLSLTCARNFENTSIYNEIKTSKSNLQMFSVTDRTIYAPSDISTTQDKISKRSESKINYQLHQNNQIRQNREESINYGLTNVISETINKKNATSLYTDARRHNTLAAADTNDVSFQRLLDVYRGMVHKHNTPVNRPQPIQHFQLVDADTMGYYLPQTKQTIGATLLQQSIIAPQNKQSYFTYMSLNTPAIRKELQGVSQPALIKGHHPKWGKKIERQNPPPNRPPPSPPVPRTTRTRPPMFDDGKGEMSAPQVGSTKRKFPDGHKFSTRVTRAKRRRTTPPRVSFEEECDYVAYYCFKAYDTGKVCGRTMYNVYTTFENFCLLDYVNCMERYEVWQIVHMGECFELKILSEYLHYPYLDDYFLDQYYIIEQN